MSQPAPFALPDLRQLLAHGFDDIIDVRAPAEYADDHLPGALSLPVLSDEERARVGTIYKQQSPFLARKIGAALVARNAASHLETVLADRPGGWQPLVYCWRGGQWSNSFASILAQIGWRVAVVQGGYKTWRRLVVEQVYDRPLPCALHVLDGYTGTAKTALLGVLATHGVQVIDLEGLANHRGSVFGPMPGGQTSQRAFEGRLALALAALDPARPLVVEAESAKIGNLRLPPRMWRAMHDAPRIEVSAPLAVRAAFLAQSYRDITADSENLARLISSLRPLHPAERVENWLAMANAGAHASLAEGLMQFHYDPRYQKSRAKHGSGTALRLDLESLGPEALQSASTQIARHVAGG
jgi:tRNA 2-selenouridine synthase